MGTFIRLFLVGLLVVVVFKIAWAMLPLVLLGFVIVFLSRHFGDKRKNDIIVRSDR